jgi:hypothetical protein
MATPVISQLVGPVRKRRVSPVAGSQASIWLLPMPELALVHHAACASVWIHNRPRWSKAMAVGAAEDVALDVAAGLGPFVGRVAGQHQVVPLEATRRRSRRPPSSG